MENINYRGIPTSLSLNGPKLGIVTDPQDQQDVIGVATFTGIATASFPDSNFDLDGGSIAFKWYFDGSQILDTTEDNNSNASIVGFSSATGTGSTITINGLTNDDNGKEVYFTADYVPSAYSQPAGSAVTAGTARSTGNAFNEPLQSESGVIEIKPFIEITQQPESNVVGRTFAAEYSIAAQKTPGGGTVNYQWQLNGNDLSDGTTTREINEESSGKIAVTSDRQDLQSNFEIDFSKVSSFDNFRTQVTYTLVANRDISTNLFAVGAGGGRSNVRSVSGGAGGSAEGTFTFVKDQVYMLRIGGAGADGSGGDAAGFSGGGAGGRGHGQGGAGGGFTGLFEGPITVGNSIIIAAGGGGGSNDPATGGAGGGLTGNAGSNGGRAGKGGTQSAGGAGSGNGGNPGGALQGGSGAAGGGGGYYGGGGGQTINGCCADGAGGGGSSYIGGVTNGSTTTGAGTAGADGSFRIEGISSTKTVTTTITGATTENLSITTDDVGSGVIRCKVTADNVQESPIFSRSVSYYVVAIRNVLNIEQYNYSQGTATLSEHNLSDGSLSLSYDSHPGNAICLYAPEKDVEVEIDMYGGKGSDNGSILGGEGGYSKIRFTMKQNEEYILTGLFDAINAPFLYRKATLIAVVGEGGDAGTVGSGGFGGGINLGGQGALGGRGNGTGADVFAAGTLPSAGLFGTATNLEAVSPDQNWEDVFGTSNTTTGGRTIPCTRGVYWRNQGKTPCEDLGTIKFRIPDGTEISNTAEIVRGYKSGYNIIQTKGKGENNGGEAGSGAAGGQGATDAQGGGGGGSGYTDGSVTVVKTTQGGSTGSARININLSAGDFFIDDQGRILIMSCTDIRDPNTLEITTGQILVGDNKVLDDARWQRFLDLARDGTQDYRLTATLNNSTTKITNATSTNIHKMMNANQLSLRNSLARGWVDMSYVSGYAGRKSMAWDETSGATITGTDYSLLWWVDGAGWGYYGSSSNPFFNPTIYFQKSANYWILPPGVPDF